MKGILMGIVIDEAGVPHIGMKVGEGESIALALPYASDLFEQLGDLLERVGYFEKDPAQGGYAQAAYARGDYGPEPETDEFGATAGCDCEACTAKRVRH